MVLLILIQYVDSDNVQIGSNQSFANTNANGGSDPNSEVNTDKERLIYFGCGTANLEAQTVNTSARPSNFTNYAKYRIAVLNNSGTVVSENYTFVLQDTSCKGFKTRRLAFRNSLGCWDYFNFTKKST